MESTQYGYSVCRCSQWQCNFCTKVCLHLIVFTMKDLSFRVTFSSFPHVRGTGGRGNIRKSRLHCLWGFSVPPFLVYSKSLHLCSVWGGAKPLANNEDCCQGDFGRVLEGGLRTPHWEAHNLGDYWAHPLPCHLPEDRSPDRPGLNLARGNLNLTISRRIWLKMQQCDCSMNKTFGSALKSTLCLDGVHYHFKSLLITNSSFIL